MDGYHPRYMRPPPPQPQPAADPNFYHHQGRPPPPPQPHLPPQNSWYPNQYHYQPPPPPSSHSPSPPPPHQQSWGPPLPPYPPPQPYHQPNQNHHHFPPPPSHPYPYPNQEWANPNWGQHQGWDYSAGAHTNAEDWAAKARAWAASKTVEDQHPQSQYPQPIKPEEQGQFHAQHFQPGDSHYQDAQQPPFPAPGYQDYPVTAAALHQPSPYPGDPTSFNNGTSSYKADDHLGYQFGAGNSAGVSTTSSSVHQQEVPSSYSSVTGNYNHKEQPYNSMSLPSSTIHEERNRQPSPRGFGKSVFPDHSFAYGGQGSGLGTDPRDQPLNFVHTHHGPAGDIRGSVSGTPLSSVSSWTPNAATGTLYPPVPPDLPSVAKHDPSVPFPSTVTGNAAPPFASYSAISNFQPTVPSAASYTVAAGTDFNSITSFPGDAYGVSNVSDRPKKASVPNWLKEEIIKNASAITRSTTDHPREETKSIEDGVDKSFLRGDQADSKSIDSTRSTEEEEDDDEDDAEAARTAVINQEIRRVLTEVLLKVTDELFDEIATKVLNEDDPRGEVKRHISSKDHKTSPSSPAVLTPKAEAKILVPAKVKKPEYQDGTEKSSSGLHGSLLGLANYATDEDDDDEDGETRVSSISSHRDNAVPQLSESMVSEEVHIAAENGTSSVEHRKSYHGHPKSSPGVDEHDSSKVVPGTFSGGTSVNGEKTFGSILESQVDVAHRANASTKSDILDPDNSAEILTKDNSRTGSTKVRSNQSEPPDSRADYAGKGYINETESSMTAVMKDSGYRRGEDMNGLKDRVRDQVEKTREKVKELDSRRRTSQADAKEDRKEEKLLRASAKEDADRNTPAKHKEDDRDRRKHASESSRHKRRRSPSDISRHRNSKGHDSSDEASDDSKRSLRKRQSSPSSVRSKGRHHSRSPNGKHSQRRHSPYSSLETTRGHKMRSRSPSRRHR